jgi:hypothetical protein
MDEEQLHLSIPKTAEDARIELLKTLKNADNQAGWMDFMDSVTRLMPEVLSPGRPSADVIATSPIGQLGFKSWSEMIEDPKGLNWNLSGWKAWRRAWAVVQEHPWLRSQLFSSSEVNTLSRTYDPFPASAKELEALRAEKQKSEEKAKTQTMAELKQEAESAKEVIGAVMRQLNEALEDNIEMAKNLGSLQTELDKAKGDLARLQSAAGNEVRPSLSRIGHLKAFIFGV